MARLPARCRGLAASGELLKAQRSLENWHHRKLEYYREGGSEKHLRDIRSMLAISGDQVDRAAPDEWVRRQGVEREWRKATGTKP